MLQLCIALFIDLREECCHTCIHEYMCSTQLSKSTLISVALRIALSVVNQQCIAEWKASYVYGLTYCHLGLQV